MSLLEITPTQYLKIPVRNPSKTRGIYIKYGYKIFNPSQLHNKTHPPLLMLTGLTGTQYDFGNALIQNLSSSQSVITVDNRGIGDSIIIFDDKINLTSHHKPKSIQTRPIPSFTLQDLAEDNFMLLKYLKINKINILGLSMGGMITQCFISMYPQMVNHIFLDSTQPCDILKAKYQNIDGNKHLINDFVNGMKKKYKTQSEYKEYLKKLWIIDCGDDLDNIDMERLDEHINYAMNKKRPWKTIVAQMMAINKWEGMENLKVVNEYVKLFGIDVVVVHGDKDLILNYKNAEYMHQNIENSRFYLLKGEGHFIHVTKRGLRRLTGIVQDQLNKVRYSVPKL